MSMLNKLKESQKNPVFLDDDDIDNMDLPLPGSSNDAMHNLQNMMRNMSVNTPPPAPAAGPAAVVMTPQGVRRLDPSEYKDWVCVYPCYIDADKTVSEGRKVIKKYAVSKPNAYHMALATQRLGLSVVYEGKRHPRDWATVGRIKVQMKNNNFFIHSHITTRKQLYVEIAKRLPEVVDSSMPENIVTPMTSLAEIEAIIDKQRKAQGLPTLAEMREQQQQKTPNLSKRKQKVKYVRG